jgi:hypothetical protein
MIMYTDSVNLTEVAVKSGAGHAFCALQRNGWPPDSFHHLIMHQTSGMTMNSARKEINRLLNGAICHDGNTINNLEQRGNTASTSHLVALADQLRNNKIQAGDRVVFSISATGLTVGTALYVFDDLPDRFRQLEAGQTSQIKETLAEERHHDTSLPAAGMRIESVGTIPKEVRGMINSMDLLNHAATNCLQHSAYHCSDIELLMYCGVYRSEYLLQLGYAPVSGYNKHECDNGGRAAQKNIGP